MTEQARSSRTDLAVAGTTSAVRARWFSVLADPTRLAILTLLLDGPHSVGELVTKTGVPQSRVSNHLACLRWCRFVTADRHGRRVVYTIADPRLRHLLDLADNLLADNAEHLATCHRIGPDWV
ncbi:ArsR/SmtB family transcription factor [Catenulispora rubra]|uniref:ArsR/SmtB family transcription factor n=1 Tax=Catenulispora rubra TaxID=280293 RepID=UPI002B27299D|nr:metalloregulator ArsR/SmtB family transcription factor [Catenulispora rubra]